MNSNKITSNIVLFNAIATGIEKGQNVGNAINDVVSTMTSSNNDEVSTNADNYINTSNLDINVQYTAEGQLNENIKYGLDNTGYGGVGKASTRNNLSEARRDSAKLSNTKFFKSVNIKRDTIR